jgi:glycosyltransferase involved in cell wall biosynthesis
MRTADLFVLPSRIAEDGDRDGLPNVLMEAASQRLPLLSTPVSAIPEFIDDGVHGLLRKDDPSELADAISVLARDRAYAERLADAAYERLTTSFRMDPGIVHLAARLRALQP